MRKIVFVSKDANLGAGEWSLPLFAVIFHRLRRLVRYGNLRAVSRFDNRVVTALTSRGAAA